jgi:hypothetical protein
MNIKKSESKHLTVKVSNNSSVAVEQEAHSYSDIKHNTPCTLLSPFHHHQYYIHHSANGFNNQKFLTGVWKMKR